MRPAIRSSGWSGLRSSSSNITPAASRRPSRTPSPITCARSGEPNRILNGMVERALYPAYRDACLEAEVALGASRPRFELGAEELREPAPPAASAPAPGADVGADASRSRRPRREGLPRGRPLGRQALPPGDEHGRALRAAHGEEALRCLHPGGSRNVQAKAAASAEALRHGSPKSRGIVVAAADERPTGLAPAELGLAPPTINRHITALRVIHRWAGVSGIAAPMWSFENLHIGVSKKKRDRSQRPPTSLEDLRKVFALPIFTGCKRHRGGTGQVVLRARFTRGRAIHSRRILLGPATHLLHRRPARGDLQAPPRRLPRGRRYPLHPDRRDRNRPRKERWLRPRHPAPPQAPPPRPPRLCHGMPMQLLFSCNCPTR